MKVAIGKTWCGTPCLFVNHVRIVDVKPDVLSDDNFYEDGSSDELIKSRLVQALETDNPDLRKEIARLKDELERVSEEKDTLRDERDDARKRLEKIEELADLIDDQCWSCTGGS